MLKLIQSASLTLSDIKNDLVLDKNKNKSLNTLLAVKALSTILGEVSQELISTFDLILTTGEGEAEETFKLYKDLVKHRVRPTLFMNSLHNSTLGAISLEISGIRNGHTISNGDLSFEYGLEVALASSTKLPMILVGVDVYGPEMLLIHQRIVSFENPHSGLPKFQSGAVAGLFLPENHPHFTHYDGLIIKNLKYVKRKFTKDDLNGPFYSANGLTFILQGILSYIRPSGVEVQIIYHE